MSKRAFGHTLMLQQVPMVKSRLLPIGLLLMLAGPLAAQKNYKRSHYQMLDQARMLHLADDHEEAAKLYKRLLNVDTTFGEVSYAYGHCLVNIPNMRSQATPYFERAVRHDHTEAYFELAQARHRQQRFEESIDLYERYKKLHMRAVKDKDVDRQIEIARNARELVKQPVDVRIRNMGSMINSTAHDHCPLVTADGNTMYFTSRRQGTRGGMKDPTGQYLEDIYVVRRMDGIWSHPLNAGPVLNTIGHDATVGLAADGSSMIIYRTGKDMITGNLYEARMHAQQWQNPVLMTEKINSKHHEPSASIAPDGDEVYFSSDRPGGFGGKDLYRIRRLPNGEWSMPLNLGPTINTPYDEDAPFVHSDGTTLFFSSTGHNTMGGYDIFKAVLIDSDMNGWGKPENLGYPLNTVNDDIFFTLSADGQTGYFSSERNGGLGGQDIYEINFAHSQLDHVFALGLVTGMDDEPLKARLLLTDPVTEEIVGIYNTNENTGRFLMLLSRTRPFHLTVEAPGFITMEREVMAASVPPDEREMRLEIHLEVDPERERLTRQGP